jgi:translation initiation factor IF-3
MGKNFSRPQVKRTFINEQIRATEMRVIDEAGEQLGVLSKEEAIKQAKSKELDLILVTDKTSPVICKIYDYGKFLYQEQKKESKKKKATGGELKGVRLKFNTSPHDLETKAKQAIKFIEKGNKIKIEMVLRGRERALQSHAREKINTFIQIIENSFPLAREKDIQKGGRGLIAIISKK